MAFLSCEEMLAAARSQKISLAEAVLRSDLEESRLTEAHSRAAMRHLWQVMQATSQEYDPTQRSRSGLSGGDAAKVEQAWQQGRLLGDDYLAAVTAEALKTAECNACMKRIVAAPTAGSCGVLPAVLLPLCGVINWSGIAKNTDWGVLLLFGGGITLSSILVQTGAAGFLADQVSSLAMGHSPIVILLIISLFITSLTEFCSNTASAALVAPLMVTVASAMGMSATPLVLLVGIGASCAFMLPVSTPPNALAFATGKFPQMTMVKVGLLINVVLVFVKAFWAWIFWM